MKRVLSEQEIIDPVRRKEILTEILGAENQRRKDAAWRRYQAYKDKTDQLVIEQLSLQFDPDTVREMTYAIANLSVVRKIVNKLARVYSNGVTRDIPEDEVATKSLQEIEREICFNEEIKRTNRFLRLQHNTMLYVRPCPTDEGKWTIKPETLQPYLYDAIEDPFDRTKPMIVVLSNYAQRQTGYINGNEAKHGPTMPATIGVPKSDGKDQLIADPDLEQKEFIWWTRSYHFTTNCEGEIIKSNTEAQSESDRLRNPIQMLPMVNFALDQDGKFWAEGGSDLYTGGVLINSMISQINHIAVIQGYGQFWMKGKNLPRSVKVGPSKTILLEWSEKEDPEPSIGFASANPNLDALRGLVEGYTALLLTTNNLSTSGVSSSLSSGPQFPSGVAMMIDKSESREDVQDQEQIFRDKEPIVWTIIAKWMDAYGDSLVDGLKGKTLPTEKLQVNLTFGSSDAIVTESEKLANLKLRKELGLNTLAELLILDQPGMTDKEAKAKIQELADEKAERVQSAAKDMIAGSVPPQPDDEYPPTDEPPPVEPDPATPEDANAGS